MLPVVSPLPRYSCGTNRKAWKRSPHKEVRRRTSLHRRRLALDHKSRAINRKTAMTLLCFICQSGISEVAHQHSIRMLAILLFLAVSLTLTVAALDVSSAMLQMEGKVLNSNSYSFIINLSLFMQVEFFNFLAYHTKLITKLTKSMHTTRLFCAPISSQNTVLADENRAIHVLNKIFLK